MHAAMFLTALGLAVTGCAMLTDSLTEAIGWAFVAFSVLTAADAISRFHK